MAQQLIPAPHRAFGRGRAHSSSARGTHTSPHEQTKDLASMDLMDVMYRLSNSNGDILGERSTVEDAQALAPSGTRWKWAEAGFPGDCNGRHGEDTYTIRMFAKPNIPTQTHHRTWVTCDVQQFIGGGWRSVFMVSSKDKGSENPDRDAQEWLSANREPGAGYRIARTIRTLIITVDPA